MPSLLKPEIIRIDPLQPEPALIAAAVAILRAGGVIAYPTETFYGLGADAGNAAAVERIFAIKGRLADNPIALIAGNQSDDINRFAAGVSTTARRLMQAFWPGPLTLLFPAAADVLPRLTAGTGKIGMRVSSHPVAAALAMALERPITATSANFSGEKSCLTAVQVQECLGKKLDAIIDGGPAWDEQGSTMLDITVEPPVVIREGTVPKARIYALLHNLK
jgi:L-threonylcarbamoyladenylate synthase